MYRTVVIVYTAQWSLCVPHSGHCMYRTVVTICTTQRSLYVPHIGRYMYRTLVAICTAQWSLYVPHTGHYMYRQFNIHQLYVLPTQLYLCVLCGSQNKQPLFPYTTLTDWFVKQRQCVFTARYGLDLYIQFYVLPTQLYLSVLCGSQNKQRLFHYTALTGWF